MTGQVTAGYKFFDVILEALDYARGAEDNAIVHVPKQQALLEEELNDVELKAIARAEVPPGYVHLDLECED
jgi:hypothetical protein